MGSLLNRSPEMDMIILAGAVAGAGPMRNNFQAVQRAIAPEPLKRLPTKRLFPLIMQAMPKSCIRDMQIKPLMPNARPKMKN